MTSSKKGRLGALSFLLFALALSGAPAEAQQRPKIGVTLAGSPPDRFAEMLRRGLAEHGWIDGKNISIEYRYAAGLPGRDQTFMEEFVRAGVDVIVPGGGTGAARAAMRATNHIPIVVPVMADPVAASLVSNLARPGGRVTGLSLMVADTSAKRVELLREAFPKMRRIAALLDPANDLGQSSATEQAAKVFGFEMQIVSARRPDEFGQAFDRATKAGAQGMIVLSSAMLNANAGRLAGLAAEHRLPAIYANREYVLAGGLMSYGPDISDMYRTSAKYVDRVLRGVKPGDLPIEQPVKFELFINLKSARALGVTLPPPIALRADEAME